MKKLAEYFTESEQTIAEKAVSQQQQKFMGMVHAMQKGEKVKGASPELKKVARTMGKKDAKDFASTKHKGLPKKVGESEVNEVSLGDYYNKALKSKRDASMASISAKSPEELKAAHKTYFAREKGIERAKGRMAKAQQQASQRAAADRLAADRGNAEKLRSELASLEAQYDPNFEYSDDHTFWTKQREIQSQIRALKKRLAAIGESTMKKGNALLQGVRAVMEARIIGEGGDTLDHILNRFKYEVKEFQRGGDLDSDLYEALFDYYANTGEMPYGTMKARTGDPYEWVTQRLDRELGSPIDEEMMLDAVRPEEVPAFQRKATGKDFPATVDQVFDTGDKISHIDTLRKMAGLPPKTPSVIQPRID